ncbi:hypothetical protein SODALDRAFT_75835 [Sodiomyces alkalinus F11]|uniref:Uncharacterized protein n=1 Tax=Sodiomyces alkalinus (strain CBS 110278 / VKM F-3762 / F11) TaxID=1314773 RepID=A0A3N2PKE9_SODAK|nr:hypothetical protein SODALDRAFT_75835 [Sodiomyces alkalinus F11]ROT34993.1 hypothetical protein SODALDRAFT_75835 [Sodiomyces alkalinus F11]
MKPRGCCWVMSHCGGRLLPNETHASIAAHLHTGSVPRLENETNATNCKTKEDKKMDGRTGDKRLRHRLLRCGMWYNSGHHLPAFQRAGVLGLLGGVDDTAVGRLLVTEEGRWAEGRERRHCRATAPIVFLFCIKRHFWGISGLGVLFSLFFFPFSFVHPLHFLVILLLFSAPFSFGLLCVPPTHARARGHNLKGKIGRPFGECPARELPMLMRPPWAQHWKTWEAGGATLGGS